MKKILSFILLSYILSSCVGPPDPDHGLVKNLPVVINTPSAFSFSVRGDNYTLDQTIDLSFNLQEGKSVASTLIVTDFKSSDTTIVHLEDANAGTIYRYTVTGNSTRLDGSSTTKPKKRASRSTRPSNWEILD